jgi:hypothetical protein
MNSGEIDRPGERRLWPGRLNWRVVLALLIVLGLAGWRYGWPPHSRETTVYPLDEIDLYTVARIAPESIQPAGGGRCVYLLEGSLPEGNPPSFDLEHTRYGTSDMHGDPELVRIRREIFPGLVFPDLAGRRFHAGVFWVDVHVGHEGAPAEPYDPALAYSVLLMCDSSQRYEDAAELIIDLNRNRDLTDEPVIKLSDVWSHEDQNTAAQLTWFVRVFPPVVLSRGVCRHTDGETLAADVQAVPSLSVTYHGDQSEPDRLYLGCLPTSYLKGRITSRGEPRDVLIFPLAPRFGRFDGPSSKSWSISEGGTFYRYHAAEWKYDRGEFWGFTLDAQARELRDGPYQGSTGVLRAETASGQTLRIARCCLWLLGDDPRPIVSDGWTPIPRFSSFRLPHRKQPLPVGEYGVDKLSLVHGWSTFLDIETQWHWYALPGREFTIASDLATSYRLPRTLEVKAYAAIEERPRPYTIEHVWSTESDDTENEAKDWKGPRPGSKLEIGVSMSDPATGHTYSIYHRSDPPPNPLKLVIQDEAGEEVHQGTMEYG